MFKIKIYKYDSSQEANGYRGEEFSNCILQACENKEDITQEMDTAEVTLCGLISGEEFDPQTKFIMDYFGLENDPSPSFTQHWVVQKDMVEQPILSDDHYFDHHISLIEPSVVAQQRVVDNISATYKLKDVNLQENLSFDVNTKNETFKEEGKVTPNRNFGAEWEAGILWINWYGYFSFGKYFVVDGEFKLLDSQDQEYDTYYNDISSFSSGVRFKVPKMAIYGGVNNSKNFNFIGYSSIDYIIEESPINHPEEATIVDSGTFIENNALLHSNYFVPTELRDFALKDGNSYLLQEWMTERVFEYTSGVSDYRYGCDFKRYTDTSEPNAPSYITNEIQVREGYSYKITISIHEFPDDIQRITNNSHARTFNGVTPTALARALTTTDLFGAGTPSVPKSQGENYLSSSQTISFSSFCFYDGNLKEVLFVSAAPYSALALLQKAIINTEVYEKNDGTYIADVNNSNIPFYIDDSYITKLASTQVIENFYNQKNLWEILIEVGHYIHAIPELKFGADDKFLITFNELGRTDQKVDEGTKISIFNSRGVEDYISATASYVANMVQLGGEIQEWVAPKTSSGDLLVYNDTAEIQTTKPIIELLEVTAKCNKTYSNSDGTITIGDTADLTPFIYEKNVYDILGISYNVIPNRGIAMYYELGSNKIVGGNYQLPRENPDIFGDYAFKKIIWSAFINYPPSNLIGTTLGYWTNLNIADFSFFVRYRTKDDVRENHTRPDLRKYLLNSKYDRYPQHNQFNNQTDILVDSVRFGSNLYGKLIKTGNTTYEITEWNNSIDTIKHKGELYRINGDLYYVAKVTHYWYSSHIVSQVTFSKDYNELSAVIGIPSEPRFYEISEQSSIKREVSINDFILVTDSAHSGEIDFMSTNSFLHQYNHLKNLMFGSGGQFSKYVVSVFKGDKDSGLYDQTVGQSNFYKEILSPLNSYSSGATLTYEWDTVDNYSAGDKVIDTVTPTDTKEGAYRSLMGVGYTDIYGKAELLDFYILADDLSLTPEQIRALPESPINTKFAYIGVLQNVSNDTELTNFVNTSEQREPRNNDLIISDDGSSFRKFIYENGEWEESSISQDEASAIVNDLRTYIDDYTITASNITVQDNNYNGRGLGLLKDCREQISVNYNLQLITSSDTFVVSPFIFSPNKQNLKVVFLNKEVNKLTDGFIDNSSIITQLYDTFDQPINQYKFDVEFGNLVYPAGLQPITLGQFYISSYYVDDVSTKHFSDNVGYERIKAVAIICDIGTSQATGSPNIPYRTRFVLARNIPDDWTKFDVTKEWVFGNPKKDLVFTKKQ